jgi:two-component system, LuxR family, sensor kinase FixL
MKPSNYFANWNTRRKLMVGFFGLATLVLFVCVLSIILSESVSGLRNIELPMEQSLREVEVSLWEAIHAADSFHSTGDPKYETLYKKQIGEVDSFFSEYAALTDTVEEEAFMKEFNTLWGEAKESGERMIILTRQLTALELEFFVAVNDADDVLDYELQAKWKQTDPSLLAKEKAVREVEVSIWEALHAADQYVLFRGEEKSIHGDIVGESKVINFVALLEQQIKDVETFWPAYTSLAKTGWEKQAIAKFDRFWERGVAAGRKLMVTVTETTEAYGRLYEKVDAADDVLDYKMQKYIQQRVANRDKRAVFIRSMTVLITVFAFGFAIFLIFFMGRLIARPIQSISRITDEIARKGRLDRTIDIQGIKFAEEEEEEEEAEAEEEEEGRKTKNEVTHLAISLNRMIRSLRLASKREEDRAAAAAAAAAEKQRAEELQQAYEKLQAKTDEVTVAVSNELKKTAALQKSAAEMEKAQEAMMIMMEDLEHQKKDIQALSRKELDLERASLEVELKRSAELEASQAALKASQEGFYNVVERNDDGILILDEEREVVYANVRVESLLEKPMTEIIGEQFPLSRVDGTMEEINIIRKGGKTGSGEMYAVPTEWEKKKAFLVTIRDVTERIRAEERQQELLHDLEQSNKELTDFAYVVSHDLKAPLRGINSLAGWLNEDYAEKFDDEGREKLVMMQERVQRMHALIEGILEYSRIGRVHEESTALDLKTLVPQIIDLVAAPPHIQIHVKGRFPTIHYEKNRIHQVFQNLLSNAIDSIDQSKGEITVSATENGSFWVFRVTDNGRGIEKKYLERIFRLFEQVPVPNRPQSTGIGLSLARRIVTYYGGTISVDSELGKGSSFQFSLPKKFEDRQEMI